MTNHSQRRWALAFLAAAGLPASAAEPFAATGAKATLSVEYLYEAAGRKADKYDSHDWRVRRGAAITAELVAAAPSPVSRVAGPDAKQLARLEKQQAQAQKAATQMAPMMASVEQIVARCGDDEKCIERETQKLGFGMAGTKQLDDTLKTGRETAQAMQPDAPRFQAWNAVAQKGSFEIDESAHIVHADPICVSLPKARCTRDEKRQGTGALPMPPADTAKGGGGTGLVEIDTAKGSLAVQLPVVLGLFPIVETITTDEPAGTHETPTPKGPQKRLVDVAALRELRLFTLPLKGGWRNQSGEQLIDLKGERGEGGKLRLRWRFVAS
jgi:hypothetical protein